MLPPQPIPLTRGIYQFGPPLSLPLLLMSALNQFLRETTSVQGHLNKLLVHVLIYNCFKYTLVLLSKFFSSYSSRIPPWFWSI